MKAFLISLFFSLSALAGSDPSNQFKFGQAGANKDYKFNIGTTNLPGLRYNLGTAKLQFSNDGTTYSDLGTGTGSGVVYLGFLKITTDSSGQWGSSAANVSAIDDLTFSGTNPTYLAFGTGIAVPSGATDFGMRLTGPAGNYFFLASGQFLSSAPGSSNYSNWIFCDNSVCSDDTNVTQSTSSDVGGSTTIFGVINYASPITNQFIRVKNKCQNAGAACNTRMTFTSNNIMIHVFYSP